MWGFKEQRRLRRRSVSILVGLRVQRRKKNFEVRGGRKDFAIAGLDGVEKEIDWILLEKN